MNRPVDRTDSMLLEAWRAGDASAGDALLSRHATPLLRFLRRRVGADADDLQQRTLLACIETHQRIRSEGSFRSYLYTIARHELYRFFRRRNAGGTSVHIDPCALADPAPSAVDALVHAETQRALATALLQLDDGDRALLRMFYVEGWSSPALAATLGIKPTSVRARLRRVRVELEHVLGPLAHGDRFRSSRSTAAAQPPPSTTSSARGPRSSL